MALSLYDSSSQELKSRDYLLDLLYEIIFNDVLADFKLLATKNTNHFTQYHFNKLYFSEKYYTVNFFKNSHKIFLNNLNNPSAYLNLKKCISYLKNLNIHNQEKIFRYLYECKNQFEALNYYFDSTNTQDITPNDLLILNTLHKARLKAIKKYLTNFARYCNYNININYNPFYNQYELQPNIPNLTDIDKIYLKQKDNYRFKKYSANFYTSIICSKITSTGHAILMTLYSYPIVKAALLGILSRLLHIPTAYLATIALGVMIPWSIFNFFAIQQLNDIYFSSNLKKFTRIFLKKKTIKSTKIIAAMIISGILTSLLLSILLKIFMYKHLLIILSCYLLALTNFVTFTAIFHNLFIPKLKISATEQYNKPSVLNKFYSLLSNLTKVILSSIIAISAIGFYTDLFYIYLGFAKPMVNYINILIASMGTSGLLAIGISKFINKFTKPSYDNNTSESKKPDEYSFLMFKKNANKTAHYNNLCSQASFYGLSYGLLFISSNSTTKFLAVTLQQIPVLKTFTISPLLLKNAVFTSAFIAIMGIGLKIAAKMQPIMPLQAIDKHNSAAIINNYRRSLLI